MLKSMSKISHNLKLMLALSATTGIAAATEPTTEVALNTQPGIYLQELNDFKKSPEYQIVFNEDANKSLKNIRRDLENYGQLTRFQRWVRGTFLDMNTIVVTDNTMPKLHGYIAGICADHNIKLPTVFISQDQGVLNAAAQKLLTSSGAIIIFQKMITTVSDAELEAIVAHELGHIKHNHVNKIILIGLGVSIGAYYASKNLVRKYLPEVTATQFEQAQAELLSAIQTNNPALKNSALSVYNQKMLNEYVRALVSVSITRACVPLIINKRFEKQADEFAYKSMDKGTGIVDFFERTEDMDQARDAEFPVVQAAIAANSTNLSMVDKLELKMRYYAAVMGHKYHKAYRWFYHNTPYGAHPSPKARIRAAQDYLRSRAAAESTEAVTA